MPHQNTVMIKLVAWFQVVGGVVFISGQKLTFVLIVRIRENGHVIRDTANVFQTVERTRQGVRHFVEDCR